MELNIDIWNKHIEEIKEANKTVGNRTYMNVEMQKNKKLTEGLVTALSNFVNKNGSQKPNTEEKIKQLYIPTEIFNSVLKEVGFKTQVKILSDSELKNTKLRNNVSTDITAIRNSINEFNKKVEVYARKNSDYKNLRIEVKE